MRMSKWYKPPNACLKILQANLITICNSLTWPMVMLIVLMLSQHHYDSITFEILCNKESHRTICITCYFCMIISLHVNNEPSETESVSFHRYMVLEFVQYNTSISLFLSVYPSSSPSQMHKYTHIKRKSHLFLGGGM